MTTPSPTADNRWWWPITSYRPATPTILFFLGTGSDQTAINPVVPYLDGANFAVWRMPGRGARADEPAPNNLRKLAHDIATSIISLNPDRPVLAGHSFGGLLAFLTSQELERRNFTVGRFMPVVSAHPMQWRIDALYARLRGGPEKHAQRRLAKFEASRLWPPQPITDPTLLEDARQRALVDQRLGFQDFSHTPVNCPITDITAKDDELLKFNSPQRWRRYTHRAFESIIVTGGHYFHRRTPEVLSRILMNEAELAYSGDEATS
jgi:surfactin synthase thioesterase subunit